MENESDLKETLIYQGLSYEIAGVIPAVSHAGLWPSLCTIQQPTGALGASGAPANTFQDVAGMVNIPCTDAPPMPSRIQSTEVKALEEIMARQIRHVVLSGPYPALEAGVAAGWRAVIDEVVYDIMGAEGDSHAQMTRMECRITAI